MKKDSVNRWHYSDNCAYLSTDFGRDLALKKFNLSLEQLTEIVGVYKKGKRKGMLKGKLVWNKVTKGGWVRTGAYDWDVMQAQGFIAKPGVCFGFAIVDDWSEKWLILQHPDTVVDDHYINSRESLFNTLLAKERTKSTNTSNNVNTEI